MQERVFGLSRPFIFRRLHSLLGFWLVVYLCEHLLVNAQAALFFLDGGSSFVESVNRINSLPYLKVIEWLFLGLPFLIHGVWGIYYAWTARLNTLPTDGSKPSLPQYPRNWAFSWQRITSWILLFGILAHVVQMRFLSYPIHVQDTQKSAYLVKISSDQKLTSVAERLHVQLYDQDRIRQTPWAEKAFQKKLKGKEILAATPSLGSAFFLVVRETFKSPLMVILYSIFVVSACFHAFNGVWTFCIKWGLTLTKRSQYIMRQVTTWLMFVVMFLGLFSTWGTFITARV